jgi:hypothetical protein
VNSSNIPFQFLSNTRPTYINANGTQNGIAQIDCIYVEKGGSGIVPSWCSAIDSQGVSRCTCGKYGEIWRVQIEREE